MDMRIKVLLISASLVASQFVSADNQFIVDPNAQPQFQPSITTSANRGIDVINIVAPSAAGISHNKFDTFNVGEEGVIHNNSTTGNETSVLDGGSIGANINFTGQSASTIIDEVTTSNTSSIEGAIEVYGDSASLIIANPNGISCSGCSFINAPNSALTTGSVSYDQTGNIQFDTSGNTGAVSIGENGLDANGSLGTNNSNFSIISRQILLGGDVEGSDRVDVISGSNVYDFTAGSQSESGPGDSITRKAGTGSVNGLQIDASNVSSVTAGKINIIGTESGVGVGLAGDLDATAGNVEIDADGNLVIGGSVSASDDISVTTRNDSSTTVSGSLEASRDVSIQSSGNIQNSGSIQGQRTVSISAEGSDGTSPNIENTGSIVGSNVEISADGDVINDGGSDLINERGVIRSVAQIAQFESTVDASTRDAVASGLNDAINQMAGFSSTVNDRFLEITVDPDMMDQFQFVVEGVDADGNPLGSESLVFGRLAGDPPNVFRIAITSVAEGNQYRLKVNGDVQITGDQIVNRNGAQISSQRNVKFTGRTLENSASINSIGNLLIGSDDEQFDQVTNRGSSAELATEGSLVIRATDTISNQEQAAIYAEGSIDLRGRVLENSALINAKENLLIGYGDQQFDRVTNTGSEALLAAGGAIAIGATDEISNEDQAAIYAEGTIQLDSGRTIVNSGRSVIEGQDVVLRTAQQVASEVEGEAPTIVAIDGSSIINEESLIYSRGNTSITTDQFTNWRGDDFISDVQIGVDAPWVERLRIGASGSLIDDFVYRTRDVVTQTVNLDRQRSSLLSGGQIRINAGNVLNEGSTIQAESHIVINADTVTNRTASSYIGRQVQRQRVYKVGGGLVEVAGDTIACSYLDGGADGCETGLDGDQQAQEWVTERSYYLNDDGSLIGEGLIQSNAVVQINTKGDVSNDGTIRGQTTAITSTEGSVSNEALSGTLRFRNADGAVTERVATVGQEAVTQGQLSSADARDNSGARSIDNSYDWDGLIPGGFQFNGLYTVNRLADSPYFVSSRVTYELPDPTALEIFISQTSSLPSTYFADPFVEARLIRDLVIAEIGVGVLPSALIGDDEGEVSTIDQQRSILHQNGQAFAATDSGAVVGQELSAEQIALLDRPILWYVTTEIDGRAVLTPRLYFPTNFDQQVAQLRNTAPGTIGTIQAENQLVIRADEVFRNSGVVSSNGTTYIAAQDIVNETREVLTENEVDGRNLLGTTASATALIEGENTYLIADSEDETRGNIENTGGIVRANADPNTDNLPAASADGLETEESETTGRLVLRASGDVTNEALVTTEIVDVDTGLAGEAFGKRGFDDRSRFTSAQLIGDTDTTIVADGTVQNLGSSIGSTNGDVLISAAEGFTQENLTDTFVTEDSVFRQTDGGTTSSYQEGLVNQASEISGENVTIISSTGDISSQGSTIRSNAETGETILFAQEGSVSLSNDAVNLESIETSISGEITDSGITTETTTTSRSGANFLANVVEGAEVKIVAGDSITNSGRISALNGDAILSAQDVTNITQTATVREGLDQFTTAGLSSVIEGGNVVIVADSEDESRGNVVNLGGIIRSTDEAENREELLRQLSEPPTLDIASIDGDDADVLSVADLGGTVTVSATGDVVNSALVVQELYDVDTLALGPDRTGVRTTFQSGQISSDGGTKILAGGTVSNIGSAISSAIGDTIISADEGFFQTNLTSTYVDTFGINENGEINFSEGLTNQSSSVTGTNVTIFSESGDIESIGSGINAVEDTTLFAKTGDVTLSADVVNTAEFNTVLSSTASSEASATGPDNSGDGFDYSAEAGASATGEVSLGYEAFENANFVSTTVTGGGDVTIYAGGDVTGLGAELIAGGDLTVFGGESVDLRRLQTQVQNSSLTFSLGGTAGAQASTTGGTFDAPSATVDAYATFGLSSESGTTTESSNGLLAAGDNILIRSGGDLMVQTDISSGGDTTFIAVGDAIVRATEEVSSLTTSEFELDYGIQGIGLGATALSAAQPSFDTTTTDSTTYANQDVVVGGNFNVISLGGDSIIEGANITASSLYQEGENTLLSSLQDEVTSTGGGFDLGESLLNPVSVDWTDEYTLSVTDRTTVTLDGALVQNARTGDARLTSITGIIDGNLVQRAENGTAAIDALEDVNRSNSGSVDLSLESIVGEISLENIVEGFVDAVQDDPEAIGRWLVNTNPIVQRVSQLAAGIESGDPNDILGGINPFAGQIFGVIDQAAYDGQLTETALQRGGTGGTGAQDFRDWLAGGDDSVPLENPLELDGIALSQATSFEDLVGSFGDFGQVDARLGVTIENREVRQTNATVLNIGGNALQQGDIVQQIADDTTVNGNFLVLAESGFTREGGYVTESFDITEAGVTLGFDVINQDVKVGADAQFTEGDSTTIVNSNLDLGGDFIIVTEGEAVLEGTNVDAANAIFDAQSVRLTSLQDTTSEQSFGGEFEVEVGVTGDSGSGRVAANGSQSESAQTNSITSLSAENVVFLTEGDVVLQSAVLDADNTFIDGGSLIATANQDFDTSWGFDFDLGVSANQASGDGGGGGDASLDFNFANSSERGAGPQSLIRSDNLVLNLDGNVELTDSAIISDAVTGSLGGDLIVQTTQTLRESNEFGLSVSAGGSSETSAGSGNFSFGFDRENSATTNTPAGIFAGNIDLVVDGDVTSDAGIIFAQDNIDLIVSGQISETGNADFSDSFGLGLGSGPDASQSFRLDINNEQSNAQSLIGSGGEQSIQSGVVISDGTTLPAAVAPPVNADTLIEQATNSFADLDVDSTQQGDAPLIAQASIPSGLQADNVQIASQNSQIEPANLAGISVPQSAGINQIADVVGEQVADTGTVLSPVVGSSGVVTTGQVGGLAATAPSVTAAQTTDSSDSSVSEPAAIQVSPQVAFANNRAESLIRLVSQAPAAVRQQAIEQIARQLEESADLTSAPMLDGLNPTQKIEVLESTLDIASDEQQAVIEQAIELLRVDELILGFNG